MDELIESNEKILMQMAIETLKTGKNYEFAIDYSNDPYYGKKILQMIMCNVQTV